MSLLFNNEERKTPRMKRVRSGVVGRIQTLAYNSFGEGNSEKGLMLNGNWFSSIENF